MRRPGARASRGGSHDTPSPGPPPPERGAAAGEGENEHMYYGGGGGRMNCPKCGRFMRHYWDEYRCEAHYPSTRVPRPLAEAEESDA